MRLTSCNQPRASAGCADLRGGQSAYKDVLSSIFDPSVAAVNSPGVLNEVYLNWSLIYQVFKLSNLHLIQLKNSHEHLGRKSKDPIPWFMLNTDSDASLFRRTTNIKRCPFTDVCWGYTGWKTCHGACSCAGCCWGAGSVLIRSVHTHLRKYWRHFQHVYKNSDSDFYF